MLGKLLKYDLKWVYKALIIFYILALFFSIVGRGLLSIENSAIFNIMGQICCGIVIAMVINILINNLMRMWARFVRNTYKDESYLTHTLPIHKRTIYLSKVLAAIITTFTSVLVILVCLAICYYTQENMESLKYILEMAATTYNSTVISFLLVVFVIFFFEILFVLLAGYFGIVIGHKANNGKMWKSILYGFILYMIPQVITLFIIFISALFNEGIMNLFTTTEMISVNIIKTVLFLGIILYTAYIIVYYICGKKQFEKGVNVD